jgi:ribonuclease J
MNLDYKKYKKEFLFLPIGGSSEIGMNCNAYHFDGKWLIVDMGIGFIQNVPGIDVAVPNIDFLKNQKRDILGLVLTHAHEDHVGAVPYLWEELQMPIYTSKFTANFLREKVGEYDFADKVDIHEIDSRKELNLDPFKLEFIGITHSTPEMKAVLIKTSKGNVLHTGDWKFDPNPVIGGQTELEKLKDLGKSEKVLATVCDSTNIFRKDEENSEGDLLKSLSRVIKDKKGLVVVTVFASNVARLKTLIEAANNNGRKVVLTGKSLFRIVKVAQQSGYLRDIELVNDRDMRNYKKCELLVIATGCQGERNAGMNKIANDTHQMIHLSRNDTVIFSSKIIPGNEKSIFSIFNKLAERDVEVITEEHELVHVSGHYTKDDLIEMYKLVKPKIAIAVHGEPSHIREHALIAEGCGIPASVRAKNGVVILLDEKNPKIIGEVQTGYIGVDGKRLIPMDSPIIKMRYKIAENGAVFVSLVMDKKYNLVINPVVFAPGAADFKKDKVLRQILIEDIIDAVQDSVRSIGSSKKFLMGNKSNHVQERIIEFIEQGIRSAINRVFNEENGKKPVVKVAFNFV